MDSAHLASGATPASAVTSTTVAGKYGATNTAVIGWPCSVLGEPRLVKAVMVGVIETGAPGLLQVPPNRPSLCKVSCWLLSQPLSHIIFFTLHFCL